MQYYSCDFETTTQADDCHVWCWCAYNIYSQEIYKGDSIVTYYSWMMEHPGTYYFHNLRFDGEFILIFLLQQGYRWVKWDFESRPQLGRDKFATLISGNNMWYMIAINANKGFVQIYDSAKIIPSTVKKIAKDFDLPVKKGEIDYDKPRPSGYQPTEYEWDYVENDVKIVGMAMKHLLEQGLRKMTAGSNALDNLKKQFIGVDNFRRLYPSVDDFDADIRRSYAGGWVYANPLYQGQVVGPGIVLDVNSLYSYVMAHRDYPYGDPKRFDGEYQADKDYPLYVQHLTCKFLIKSGHVPMIKDRQNGYFRAEKYLENSIVNGVWEDMTLSLTNVDLQIFLEHYDVYDLEYHGGWMFRSKHDMFSDFVNYWYAKKREARQTNNAVMGTLVKLILNSCYGKFATKLRSRWREPRLSNGVLVLDRSVDYDNRKGVYLPVGVFITAYAREVTIRAAQACFDRFLYADTDSLHLLGTDLPQLDIDKFELGAWKLESTFVQAKFLRAKSYYECEVKDSETAHYLSHVYGEGCVPASHYDAKITVAGLPDNAKVDMSFEDFAIGYTCHGKLTPKHVPGGIILVDGTFTIKP